MALEQEKKGGPHSKDEHEKRQKEVFRLHFKLGQSTIKIADLMLEDVLKIGIDRREFYRLKKEIRK